MNKTLLFGRQKEISCLSGTCENIVKTKKGSITFVTGEMGSGKTFLVRTFSSDIRSCFDNWKILNASCFMGSCDEIPYHPFKELLNAYVSSDDEPANSRSESKISKSLDIAQKIIEFAPDLIDTFIPGAALVKKVSKYALDGVRILSRLKEMNADKDEKDINVDEMKISFQYTKLLCEIAAVSPVLIVIDDMQWMDDASVGLLQKMLPDLMQSPVFFILIYRNTEFTAETSSQYHSLRHFINNAQSKCPQHQIIDLNELSVEEKKTFTKQFLDAEIPGIDADFIEDFYRHTNGHPLFSNELLLTLKKNQVVSQNASGMWVSKSINFEVLPSAAAGILRERIENLDEKHRKWLDIASVQGEVFYLSTIARIENVTEREIAYEFSKVLHKQYNLVDEVGQVTRNQKVICCYKFCNKLIRQYLYEELSGAEQYQLHQLVANSLEMFFDGSDSCIYQLAFHYSKSFQYEKAYEYYLKASERAFRLGVYKRSIAILTDILQLLPSLPPETNIVDKELEVLYCLSSAYIAVYGYGAEQLASINQRAQSLRKERKKDDKVFSLLWVQWANLMVKGRFDQASWISSELSEIAGTNTVTHVEALHAQGVTSFNRGNFSEAICALEKGLDAYCSDCSEIHIAQFGNDPGILIPSWLSWAWLFTGNTGKSRMFQEQVDSRLDAHAHVSSKVFGYIYKAMWYLFQDDPHNSRMVATDAMCLIKDELLFWKYWAGIVGKWAVFKSGEKYMSPEEDINGFCNQGGTIWECFFDSLWGEMVLDTDIELADKLFLKISRRFEWMKSNNIYYAVPVLLRCYKWKTARNKHTEASTILNLARNIALQQKAGYFLTKIDAISNKLPA